MQQIGESEEYLFFKEKKHHKTIWVEAVERSIGEHLFTFDKVNIYNLFADYPHNLSPEEVEIFDKENPYWAEFFKERKE